HDCRLTADRKLGTLDEAEAFLIDRGVLTLTQDSALPSLFAATHEEPYKRGSAGFGSWPKTKWPWGGELALRPGVHALKVHRGKVLLCHQAAMRAVDPLARAAVLAHQDEVGKWFSWPVEWPLLANLIQAGRLQRPGPGWLAVG